MRAKDIFSESFDTNIEIIWEKYNKFWRGKFSVKNNSFEIIIERTGKEDEWCIGFRIIKQPEQFLSAFTVFSTVFSGVLDFIREVHPQSLSFNDGGHARGKIYRSILNKKKAQLEELGYKALSNEKTIKISQFITAVVS